MSIKKNRITNVFYIWVIALVFGLNAACFGSCGTISLETNPINPNASTPVTAIINGVCSDRCFNPCDIVGEWVSPTEFHIDWFFEDIDPCFGCVDAVTPHTSEINMGILAPGDYTITSSLYIASPCKTPCLDGKLIDQMEQSFTVGSPIPTVSTWGALIFSVMILIVATLVLQRHAYLLVCASLCIFSTHAWAVPTLQESAILIPDDVKDPTMDGNGFGSSLAISGDYLVVGALVDSTNSSNSGAAYVFKKSGNSWIQQSKLIPSQAFFNDIAGKSVAIDGDVIVVGAPHNDPAGGDFGSAYVFRRSGENWIEEKILVPSGTTLNDRFGQAVAIGGDTIVVGAPTDTVGHIYVFRWNGSDWIEEAVLVSSDSSTDDFFGLYISYDNDRIAALSPRFALYTFTRSGTSWSQETRISEGDLLSGDRVTNSLLSLQGPLLAFRAWRDVELANKINSVYLFRLVEGNWTLEDQIFPHDTTFNDNFGRDISISADRVIIGSTGTDGFGAAYIFRYHQNQWIEEYKLLSGPEIFSGFGNAITIDQKFFLVGTGESVYVYDNPPPIPTVSEWGLMILAIVLLIAATLMLRRHAAILTCLWIFVIPVSVYARVPDLSAPHHPEKMFVRFKSEISPQNIQAVHSICDAQVIKKYRFVENLYLVKVPSERFVNTLNQYLDRDEVLYAELDHILELYSIPNDPKYFIQWGMDRILAPYAWDIWTGDPDFRIAIIDTGMDYFPVVHDDLYNIWVNLIECPTGDLDFCNANGIDEDENGKEDDFVGWDFAGNGLLGDRIPDEEDTDNLHGTLVAGIVGANTNNGIGVAGINWSCDLVVLKITVEDGGIWVDATVDALEYAIDKNIKVSNNSWGGGGYNQCLYDMIEASQAIGHIFVAAAGNFGNNSDKQPHYPSDYDLPNIISVAATDSDDCLADFPFGASNFGENNVDISAPGVNILSTGKSPGSYKSGSGTSLSAPHVTGVVALIMSQNPSMPWQEVIDRVLSTVTPLTSLRGLTVTGGLLNASGALGDCNINGVQDDVDISSGTSTDCNSNAVPDECEINEDCQPNGVQDICDIAAGTSEDCNGNDYPDECELDGCGTPLTSQCGSGDCCTSNGTRGCDCTLCLHTIAKTFQGCYYSSTWSGLCAYMASMYPVCDCDPAVTTPRNDCNDNGVIDECDIAAGTSQDVIGVYIPPDTPGPDGVPDECQTDCNNNNFPDLYDVYNENISLDCNDNLVPDECETDNDCNCNGIPDDCDIASGTSADTNSNGIPDECEAIRGACCLGSGGGCEIETSCSCAARGGTFLGALNCILQPRGACCFGTTCQPFMKPCDCINQGGLFAGAGTTCTPLQCQQFGPQGP